MVLKVRPNWPRPQWNDSDLSGPLHAIHRLLAPCTTHWLHATTRIPTGIGRASDPYHSKPPPTLPLHDQLILYSFLPQSRMIQSNPPGFQAQTAQTPPPTPPLLPGPPLLLLLLKTKPSQHTPSHWHPPRSGARPSCRSACIARISLYPQQPPSSSSSSSTNVPSTWQTSDPSAHGARQPGAAPP